MRRNHTFDSSEELLVQRWGSGIKLLRTTDINQSGANEISPPSVRHLFVMPINFYFLNTESVIQNMSERTANICGFLDRNDAIGTTARATLTKESATFSIKHNEEVINQQSIIIKDENFSRLDDSTFSVVAIKFPLFNSNGKIIGVFGCSLVKDSLAQSLNLLINSGLLVAPGTLENHSYSSQPGFNSIIQQHKFDNLCVTLSEQTKTSISKREIECLFYLAKGKSARETSELIDAVNNLI